MNPRVGRRKLLAGSLGVISMIWTVDMLIGQAPKAAQAIGLGESAKPLPMPVEPPDRSRIEELLRAAPADIPPLDLATLPRDPFVDSASIRTAIAPPPASSPASATTAAPAATIHWQVQGIVLGRRPFAVINGKICSRGDVIEGHRVESIERDSVTLSHDGKRIRVRVPLPGQAEKASSP